MYDFATRLKQLRQDAGMTQSELAEKVKISKSSINMYERGEREPGLDTIKTIANCFNVSLDYLLGKDVTNTNDSSANSSDKKHLRSIARLATNEISPDEDKEIENYIKYVLNKRGIK